jgi:predicted protein tyrosine phosphatase
MTVVVTMKFIVGGRHEIERGIIVRTPYVIISISDPGKKKARIRKPTGLLDVLYLQFHDAEPEKGLPLSKEVVLMTKKHAKQIWNFVLRYRDQVGTIVVHCEQGMSRSPAVAAAIALHLGADDRRLTRDYQPNKYIYNLMVSCFPG